ncbi:MAG TPA: energy transducer TonB [Chitinophagaceae bacterium]|nr:energy transducer TonB [Chitinophagaceae bacterium]
MQTNQILSAPLIDIIFDGHNKNYGAYELRKNYSKRINKALLITITLTGLICCSALMANSSKKNRKSGQDKGSVVITEFREKKIEEPKPEKKQETKPVKTVIFTAPVIKEVVENPPPIYEDLDKVKIGTEKIDSGDIYSGIPGPKEIDNGPGIIEQPPASEEIVTFVEIDAKFIGNWVAFLERNLNANVPVDNNALSGRYSVVVQFVVDKEGNVSDIQPLTNHGYGMEQEAVRVLKKATKWEPAIQNGIKVKAYRKQVIVFEINEE